MIGKAVGLSRNTVQKYVSTLENKGLIETEKTSVFRKDGSKWNGNLKFSILPIQSALDFYNEQQAQNPHSSPPEAPVSGFVLPVGLGHHPAGQKANLNLCEGKDPPADF